MWFLAGGLVNSNYGGSIYIYIQSRRGAVLSDFPLLVWDSAADQDPQLDAGQHRRLAFLELMQEYLQKYPDIAPNNIKVRVPPYGPLEPPPRRPSTIFNDGWCE
jgi:hypothetical protein